MSKFYAQIEIFFFLYYIELITTGKEPDFTFEVKGKIHVVLKIFHLQAMRGQTKDYNFYNYPPPPFIFL